MGRLKIFCLHGLFCLRGQAAKASFSKLRAVIATWNIQEHVFGRPVCKIILPSRTEGSGIHRRPPENDEMIL